MADKYLNLQGLAEVAEYVNGKLRIVTSMPATPELDDIVLYNGASTADYKQGGIYSYKTIETYYAWSDASDTFYTKSETPAAGDTVYSDTEGTESGDTVTSYDDTVDPPQITFNSLTYDRDSTGDTPVNAWVSKGGTSVILNGTDKTGEVIDIYAPEAPGQTGQVLVSNGQNITPSWASFTGYAPQFVDNSLYFYYGLEPEVEDTTIFFDLSDNS